jgi:HPt (histidine-containing phosphotransfer) domain-containing protein
VVPDPGVFLLERAQELAGDPDLVRELLLMFFGQAADLMKGIRDGLASGKMDPVALLAQQAGGHGGIHAPGHADDDQVA